MGTPDSVNLGRNGKYGNININGLQGGVKRSDIKDGQQIKLFEKFDTNKNGILEADEIEALQKSLGSYAEDGKITKREAKKFIKENGLKGEVDKEESFEFLKQLGASSENINKTTESELDGVKTLNIEYNKGEDGTVLTEIYNQASGGLCAKKTEKDDTTVTQYYTEDGKINKETTEQAGTTTTVLYDEDGKITSKTRQRGTLTEYLDENDRVTRKETDKGQGAKEIMEYEYDEDGSIKLTTTTNPDGSKIIEDKEKTTEISPDGAKTETDKGTGDRTEYNADGKKISKTVTRDDQSYTVEYDGKNNTKGVIVQNGESPAAIAKRFGCSVQDLMKANATVLNGKKYFNVGTEIVIPREIEPDEFAKLNETRKTSDEARAEYARDEEIREQKRAAEQAAAERAAAAKRKGSDKM